MMDHRSDPRSDRKALILAPLLPAALWTLADGVDRAVSFGPAYFVGALLLGFYVAIVMEMVALVVGLPLVLTLRRHLHSLPVCLVMGGLVATLPWILVATFAPLPDAASVGGVSTVIDGRRTSQWYTETAFVGGLCLLFGAIGGLAFWWLRRRFQRRANSGD